MSPFPKLPAAALVAALSVLAAGCGDVPDAPAGDNDASLRDRLAAAKRGDTIQLAERTYDALHGETWSYSVPPGVTLRGAGSGTVLSGTGTALLAANGFALQDLTLVGFDVAVRAAEAGTVSLTDVVVRDVHQGVVLSGAGSTLEVTGGSIYSDRYAIELAACVDCKLHVAGAKLGNVDTSSPAVFVPEASQHGALSLDDAAVTGGVYVADATATLAINASDLTGNASNAGVNFAGVTLGITGSTVSAGGGPYGISLRAGTMTLSDVSIHGSNYAIYQLSGSSKLRGTKLSDYSSIGFYDAQGALDLGTATEAGNNELTGALGVERAFGIYVDTGTAPVTSSNTSFGGVVPEVGKVVAGERDLAQPGQYFLTPGQSIEFFRVP